MIVELHSQWGKRDITRWVNSVQISESTEPPWDWCQVTAWIPLGALTSPSIRQPRYGTVAARGIYAAQARGVRGTPEPEPPSELIDERQSPDDYVLDVGMWLKIMEPDTGRLRAFGRITGRPAGLLAENGGGVFSSEMPIRAVGVMEWLRTMTVRIAPIGSDIGSLLAIDGPRFRQLFAITQRLILEPSASFLAGPQGILSILADVEIPPELFPGKRKLWQVIDVAHDDDSGKRCAPTRIMDPVPAMPSKGLRWLIPQGGLLDLILGTFQHEPRLIEFFPSLEGATNDPMAAGYADVKPVIIHRMRPWRMRPVADLDAQRGGGGHPLSGRWFNRQTWRPESGFVVSRDEGFDFSSDRTDAMRYNCVNVKWSIMGGSEGQFMRLAGMPIYDERDIALHNTRMMEVGWDIAQFQDMSPSMQSGRAVRTSGLTGRSQGQFGGGAMLDLLAHVGLQAWQFYGLGHVFESGSISGPGLGAQARPGVPVTLHYGGERTYIAYATRVTHSYEMMEGGIKQASTRIEFQRGLWDERGRDILPTKARSTTKRPTPRITLVEREPEPAPAPSSDLVAAGASALSVALAAWSQGYVQPVGEDDHPASRAFIDAIIRTDAGLTWGGINKSHLPAGSPGKDLPTYITKGDFDWCGAFVAHAWGQGGGLNAALRQMYFSSVGRIKAWAEYRLFFSSSREILLRGRFPDPGDDTRRLYLALSKSSVADSVAEFGPRAGDILLTGEHRPEHITLLKSYDGDRLFETVGGNQRGTFPDGSSGAGVTSTVYSLGSQRGYKHIVWAIMRPSTHDLVMP